MADAAKITRQSKSNLALAFVSLGRERREDITTFYAFCRVIDDIADSSVLSAAEKTEGLRAWRSWLAAPGAGEDTLAPDVRRLLAKYRLAPAMLEEIITGVEMDLTISRYQTFAELRVYCYRVASAVGLVSIEIFGYANPRCQEYAVELGLALQTTNIIRDVGKDARLGRIYLPAEEMARFGYAEADLLRETNGERFRALMQFQADRAHAFFDKAAATLPREDRRSMVAAEIMGGVYRSLLRRMEKDGFRVFEKEYRLNRLQKAGHVAARLLRFR
ncbi:MAG TPA: squalene/phytoene synthase family protein [Chthoniobacterales bacterium]|nr:squalene/phytoene synthase family protein [Chthoniobacterales bacterium]